jgi:protein-S-isoprenylcysteine O-methyltransferase Ste14
LTLCSLKPWSVAVLILFCATQVVRMRLEERALTEAFPEYGGYAKRTPRLLPRFSPLIGVTDPRASEA